MLGPGAHLAFGRNHISILFVSSDTNFFLSQVITMDLHDPQYVFKSLFLSCFCCVGHVFGLQKSHISPLISI